ncbi:hypothetical protein JZK55_09500 [Dissulfurispira thermophila]|uniref:FecR protein domain-containing protein n=2 Tax=root TaxID=1 RepID=A0A7G1H0E7_9BACT|nr:FecR domain-containing protein [Dissulfurispira thermophila]BCB96028.1 hypothetical protein JZK55_09500 [Dissulfurispira thermophila]
MKRLAFIMIMFISLFIFYSYSEGDVVGKLSDMSGRVLFKEKSIATYQKAEKGMTLKKGFWIKTGTDGWAVLQLSDNSRLTLANNTELEITEFLVSKGKKDGVFSVMHGKLRASITRLAGENVNYKIKSPTAVAGIKGTEFMMMTQGFANVFFGNEGQVEVSGDATPSKPLTIDTMVQNTRNYTPTDPVKVEPDTPLYAAKKDFEAITEAVPPKDWEISGNLPNIIARWNINYGHYLADAGRYEEALYVFQIALDLTSLPEIRSDARLERGAVYSRFLRNPEAALAEYLLVIETYPIVPQRETALYLAGMTLYELGLKEQAKEKLLQYKKEYPSGKHISNVETILDILDK